MKGKLCDILLELIQLNTKPVKPGGWEGEEVSMDNEAWGRYLFNFEGLSYVSNSTKKMMSSREEGERAALTSVFGSKQKSKSL